MPVPMTEVANPSNQEPLQALSTVRAPDASLEQLGPVEKHDLLCLLADLTEAVFFPTDPKWASACIDGEHELPLRDESCKLLAAKQRRFPSQERLMIGQKIGKLLDRDIIRVIPRWGRGGGVICLHEKRGS